MEKYELYLAFPVILIVLIYAVRMILFSLGILALSGPGSKINSVSVAEAPVTVIIAARNEEKNIDACLRSLVGNGLPAFAEVIVVDDHSNDGTARIIMKWSDKIPAIQLLKNRGEAGKKNAISEAMKIAKGELILFTDAA